MDKLDMLKTLVNERLSIAAEEIYGMGARIIWEVEHQYKADVSRLQEENERQRKLLDAMLKPDVRLKRSGLPEEQIYSEKKKGNHCLGQEVFQPPKKEMRQEDPDEADHSEVSPLIVKSNVEENTPPLHLNMYSDGEDCEIPEQTDDDGHLSTLTSSSKARVHQSGKRLWSRKDTGVSVEEQRSPLKVLKSCESPPKDTGTSVKGKRSSVKTLKSLRKPRKQRKSPGFSSSALVCKVCKKSFDTKKILLSHIKEHLNDCGLCGQELEPTETLKVHLQAHRTCDVCGKKFTKYITLAKHMRSRHTEGKSLTCTICCKTFRKENLLQSHSRIHRGEKPYSCTVCEKSFRHSTSLDKHKRIHTGDRPFSCMICDKRFRQKTHLTKHMTTHTGDKPFTCTICHESFRLKGTMKNHMFRHAGEKPFPCSICGKRLARLDSMLRHMKLHEREPVEAVEASGSDCIGSA